MSAGPFAGVTEGARKVVLVALALTACSAVPFPPGQEAPAGPVLGLRVDDRELRLHPVIHCPETDSLLGACADEWSVEPSDSVDLPEDASIVIVPPAGFTIEARIRRTQDIDCPSFLELDIVDGSIEDLGEAGSHLIEVLGIAEGESATWAFQVEVDHDRPTPSPHARLRWAPGGGNIPALTPLTVRFRNLAVEPADIRGTVTVTAASGRSMTVELIEIDEGDCWNGASAMEAPMSFTSDVATLGSRPYRLSIELSLDDHTLRFGPVLWPEDFPRGAEEILVPLG